MATIQVTGLENLQSNLKKKIGDARHGAIKGMIKSAIMIQRATENELPITPLDYGNLRSSFFVTTAMETPVGLNASFEGPKAMEMASEHSKTVQEANSECVSSSDLLLIMGYSANYAVWVHEMIDPTVNWSRPGSGPKWFEIALNRNRENIKKLVGNEIKASLFKGFTAGVEISEII